MRQVRRSLLSRPHGRVLELRWAPANPRRADPTSSEHERRAAAVDDLPGHEAAATSFSHRRSEARAHGSADLMIVQERSQKEGCIICFDGFDTAVCCRQERPCVPHPLLQEVTTLPCSHTFHYRCISQWAMNNSCPVCRYINL
eukprot:768156-Hanusia_phi.AAC.8